MIKSCSIEVRGRVQGVGYRYWVRDTASDLGLKGFVSNRYDDRTVQIEAEGEEQEISDLIEQCRTGPPLARVTDIRVDYVPLRNYKEFVIRH